VYVDGMEGYFVAKMQRHHNHPCYPEKYDVEAGY